jgi:hypothetical protein
MVSFLAIQGVHNVASQINRYPFLNFWTHIAPLDTQTEKINLMELSPPLQAIGKLHTTLISQSHIEEVSAEQIPPCHNT